MNAKLKKQLDESKQFFDSLPWEEESFYSDFLAQTYFFVCQSTRLLAKSISTFGVDRDFLYKRFVAHLKEENYHEKLALTDLKNLNLNIADFSESPFTKTFWESQYYKIDISRGTSLLGYILFLEAIAVHCFDDSYELVKTRYGAKSANFMRVHIDEDPTHLDQALELINSLSDLEQEVIWENFDQSAEIYHSILLKIFTKVKHLSNVA